MIETILALGAGVMVLIGLFGLFRAPKGGGGGLPPYERPIIQREETVGCEATGGHHDDVYADLNSHPNWRAADAQQEQWLAELGHHAHWHGGSHPAPSGGGCGCTDPVEQPIAVPAQGNWLAYLVGRDK